MPFKTTLQATRENGKWRINAPLIFASIEQGKTFTVPAGFVSDFASVPRVPFAFWLTGDTAHEAAVVHDWLYVSKIVDKKTADKVFLEAMKETGVAWWRRSVMWAAVALFGGRGGQSTISPETTQ